ncbi:integrase [Elizabethkingia anophelis]|nr:integrase [Elizabethkingia anophelis]
MKFLFYTVPSGATESICLKLTNDNDNCFKFSTILKISGKDWDQEMQRPGNIYLKRYKKINNILDRIKIEVNEYICVRQNKNKGITHRGIAKEIRKICTQGQPVHPENSLLYFMQKYIDTKRQMIDITTYKRYNVFYNLIRRFEGYHMKHLMIEDVNSVFLQEFLSFGQHEEYSESTIYRTINFVKTILHYVEEKGIRTPVMELKIRKIKNKKKIISLTEPEILAIKKTPLPKELQIARDWLIISCYTGQRFSDFMCFSSNKLLNIEGKTCIEFTQKKTQKDIILPLHPVVLDILKNYNYKFPQPISMKNYNEQIKLIARHAGLNFPLMAGKRIGHRIKRLFIEKWKVITSHIGRRSFATNFYGKIPTPLLMEATGHSTEQMFLKYINPVHNERIIALSNHFDNIYYKKVY